MGLLESLQAIIKLDLSKTINIRIKNQPNKKDKVMVSESGEVSLNLPSFDDAEKMSISSVIREGFVNKEITILENKTERKVEDIKQILESKSSSDTLNRN